MERVYIGIGANLGTPERTVEAAITALEGLAGTGGHRRSRLYRTAPVGPQDQPDYVNAAMSFDTDLAPAELLACLHGIEADFGRVRAARWGPRTLDLDLLLYGDRIIDAPDLSVPHPHLSERGFVLAPLTDLDPGLRHPVLGERVDTLYAAWREATPDATAKIAMVTL